MTQDDKSDGLNASNTEILDKGIEEGTAANEDTAVFIEALDKNVNTSKVCDFLFFQINEMKSDIMKETKQLLDKQMDDMKQLLDRHMEEMKVN